MDTDQYIRPPGTYYDLVQHPSGMDRSSEVAIVQDHRFAFFYWLKWAKTEDGLILPATLVSLDWHQDLAAPCDLECDWLKDLNTNDFREVGFFCWDKLHCHNDGHILAAAYLNIIGDIHVAQKQDEPGVSHFDDAEGRSHAIHCYDSIESLVEAVSSRDHPRVIFDIDLDYFTESPDSCGGGQNVSLVTDQDIRSALNPEGSLLAWVFPRMEGMTIATEPEFCGGLVNSNHLFSIVNDLLFDPQLCSHRPQWRHLG